MPFIKNDSIWLIPFEGMWWAKVRVNDCEKAIKEMWAFGDLYVVDLSNQVIFYIGIYEPNYEVAIKQLCDSRALERGNERSCGTSRPASRHIT